MTFVEQLLIRKQDISGTQEKTSQFQMVRSHGLQQRGSGELILNTEYGC